MSETTLGKEESRRIAVRFLPCLAAALVLSLLAPRLLELIFACGNHLFPYLGPDLAEDYSLGVLWAICLGGTIFFWPVPPREREALLRIWVVKVLVTLVVMLGYEFRYGLDPDGYFSTAVSPGFAWRNIDFEHGTEFLHNLTWLHLWVVPESYHAAKVGWAMVGLLSVFLFYRAGVIFLGRDDIRVLYALALFPSILFWSSILGKDPIVLFGFALYVYGVVAMQRLRRSRYLLPLACGILLCSVIRIWLVPITLVPLSVFVFAGRRSLFSRLVILLGGASALGAGINVLQQSFRLATLESVFESRDNVTGAFVGGGSSFKPPEITCFADLFTALPQAVFNALFRPLPWDIPNLFGFIEGLDGLVLLALLCLSVKRTRLAELKDPVLCWAALLVVIWGAIYGLATYNLGSLVRYKLQILPTALGLLLYLGRRRGGNKSPAPRPPLCEGGRGGICL